MFKLLSILALIITPAFTLVPGPIGSPRVAYATYAGTGPGSVSFGLAVDSTGFAYVPGSGPSTGVSRCAFLTKLNQIGTAAVWSVCLPMYQVNAVVLDAAGYIYVAGADQPSGFNPSYSSTVMKLTPDAQQTIFSASISETNATNIALDRSGNVYVTGWASSSFKATPGAYLATGGNSFVVKLSVTGSLLYATYLDFIQFGYPVGSGDIAVDSKGQAWVVGATCPVDGGSSCDLLYGSASAVRKLDATGSSLLVKKTFGGGATADHGYPYRDAALGVAVDANDSVWVVGTSESSGIPTTANALEPRRPATRPPPGNGLGYAVKFSPNGDLLYGTYVGDYVGGTDSAIASVTVDNQGDPYFAVNSITNVWSAKVMALSPDGATVLVSTDLSSPVQAIALDGKGGLYTAGSTTGVRTTPGAYQPLYPGGFSSGYVAKFDLTQAASASQLSTLLSASLALDKSGSVAPGEIVTIFGKNLPPSPKVTFDGRPAPVLYADANQINAVVPFAVSGPGTAVTVDGAGGFNMAVSPAVPALFTADAGGTGQVAALNEDGSVNSSSRPAKAGSVIAAFMTGLGAMTPAIGDGQLGPLQPPFPTPVLGVGATVNGVVAQVLFTGQAPGLIAGAAQVNVRIPAGTVSGNARFIVYVGNYQSQFFEVTTIAVQ